jgi:hypothetical protein
LFEENPMKKNLSFCGLAILLAVCGFAARASILESGAETMIFLPEKLQKGITWSNNFSLKETGLETKQLPVNQSQDVWVQTHAFPIGLSWRPPTGANFTAYFEGSLNDADPNFRSDAQLFIRYSCDKINWSTWYSFNKTDKKTSAGFIFYEGQIRLPQTASEQYRNLMSEWWKTNPVWSSDETEFCEWLVKKEPDFFAREMPFIGYVQVRIEKMSINSAQNLKSLTVGFASGVGGLASIPRDKSKVRKNTEDYWFFEGKQK